jgi:predicted RNA polymerase sigma factor
VTAKSGVGTEDLLRQLAPQVLGALVRRCGHFDLCEDAVQEALLAAALQWPDQGVPRESTWLADHRGGPPADRRAAQ